MGIYLYSRMEDNDEEIFDNQPQVANDDDDDDVNDDDDEQDDLVDVTYDGGELDSDRYSDEIRELLSNGVPIRLIINPTVTEIDEGACYKCPSFCEVAFHNNITIIREMAFFGCGNLRRLQLPEGLIHLG